MLKNSLKQMMLNAGLHRIWDIPAAGHEDGDTAA